MGIDAAILLRVKGTVTDEQIKRWSYEICNSIGAEKFFVNREKGYGAIARTLSRYREEDDPAPETVFYQDGPDIIAEKNETLLEVKLWSRYYGIDYERGDLLTICAVAEWCETNIPNVEVWYGGDSSGVEAAPFPDIVRTRLRLHLYSADGRKYFNGYGSQTPPFPPLTDCKLCIEDKQPVRYGWGQTYAAWICHGCGKHFITRDNGATWTDKEEEWK